MDTIVIIAGLAIALLWAIREVYNERLKNKQLPGLQKDIKRNEEQTKQATEAALENASASDVVDFLNELHSDDTSTD